MAVFEPFLQRAGLEAVAVRAVVVLDRVAHVAVALDQRFGKWRGVVGGIVEHLDLQQLLRVLDLDDFFDQPLDDVTLVIQGKLDGDRRQLLETHGRFAGARSCGA